MTDDRPEWMDPVDDEILEALAEDDVFMPDQVAETVEPRTPHVAYRCRTLAEYGLVTKHAIGMYDLNEQGRQYLAGELDPNELDPEEG